MQTGRIKTAIFPVGGLGTRFLPATKAMPKEMLPIANKPLIQHAFEEACAAGIERFIFITGRNKNIIVNHFDCVYELEDTLANMAKNDALSMTRDWLPPPGNITFIRQQKPLGLGHAVWCARHAVPADEPFAVLLADELFLSDRSCSLLKEMVEMYEEQPGNIIAVSDIPHHLTHRYGVIEAQNDNGITLQITNMVEKPKPEKAPSNISIVGRYIIHPAIFPLLEATNIGVGNEIQLTDALNTMLQFFPTYGYRFAGNRMDCGNPIGFLEANLQFALRDANLKQEVRSMINNMLV